MRIGDGARHEDWRAESGWKSRQTRDARCLSPFFSRTMRNSAISTWCQPPRRNSALSQPSIEIRMAVAAERGRHQCTSIECIRLFRHGIPATGQDIRRVRRPCHSFWWLTWQTDLGSYGVIADSDLEEAARSRSAHHPRTQRILDTQRARTRLQF